jgi:hypothetical protein
MRMPCVAVTVALMGAGLSHEAVVPDLEVE